MNRIFSDRIKLHARMFDLLSATCVLLFSRRRSLVTATLLAFALGSIVQSPATAQTRYHFDAVPVPEDEDSYQGLGLTNDGVIVSQSQSGQFGFITEKDGSRTIVKFPGSNYTEVIDIANDKTVTGYYATDPYNGPYLCFTRSPQGVYTSFAFGPGVPFNFPTAINAAGTALGFWWTDTTFGTALRRKNGGITNISIPGYEDVGWAGVNNQETLVGASSSAWIAHGGKVEEIVLPGAPGFRPRINNRGEVAGGYYVPSGGIYGFTGHGFVRDVKGVVTTVDYHPQWPLSRDVTFPWGETDTYYLKEELGTEIRAINDRGQILGVVTAVYQFGTGNAWSRFNLAYRFIATPEGQ